jgi:hypothetical protein
MEFPAGVFVLALTLIEAPLAGRHVRALVQSGRS